MLTRLRLQADRMRNRWRRRGLPGLRTSWPSAVGALLGVRVRSACTARRPSRGARRRLSRSGGACAGGRRGASRRGGGRGSWRRVTSRRIVDRPVCFDAGLGPAVPFDRPVHRTPSALTARPSTACSATLGAGPTFLVSAGPAPRATAGPRTPSVPASRASSPRFSPRWLRPTSQTRTAARATPATPAAFPFSGTLRLVKRSCRSTMPTPGESSRRAARRRRQRTRRLSTVVPLPAKRRSSIARCRRWRRSWGPPCPAPRRPTRGDERRPIERGGMDRVLEVAPRDEWAVHP